MTEKNTQYHSHNIDNSTLPEILIRHSRVPSLHSKKQAEYNNLQSSLIYRLEMRNDKTICTLQRSNGQNKRNQGFIRLGSNLTQYVNNDIPMHHHYLNPSILGTKRNASPPHLDSLKKGNKSSNSSKLKRIIHSIMLPSKQSQRLRCESKLEKKVSEKENTVEPVKKITAIKPGIDEPICELSRILSLPRQQLLDKWRQRGCANKKDKSPNKNKKHLVRSDSTESIETIFCQKYN